MSNGRDRRTDRSLDDVNRQGGRGNTNKNDGFTSVGPNAGFTVHRGRAGRLVLTHVISYASPWCRSRRVESTVFTAGVWRNNGPCPRVDPKVATAARKTPLRPFSNRVSQSYELSSGTRYYNFITVISIICSTRTRPRRRA